MTAVEVPPRRAVGRPRLHPPEVERALLLDAAYGVLREQGAQALTVGDVLRIAGMSTRAFYRHFAGKDQLLAAMYRRDADAAAALLRRQLAGVRPGREQVIAWIDEILSFTASRTRVERVSVLGALPATVIAASSEPMSDLVAPLREAIEHGIAAGELASTDAAGDARMVAAVVFDAAGLAPGRPPTAVRGAAREALVRFCLRALGGQPAG